MKPPTRKSLGTCRCCDRGSILIDVGVSLFVVTVTAAAALALTRSLHAALDHVAGLPYMYSSLEQDVFAFRSSAPGSIPDTTPRTAGSTDAGDVVQRFAASSYDGGLGLRTFTESVFCPGTTRVAMGGAARLEPLPFPAWIPDTSTLSTAETVQHLTVSPGSSGAGTVAGSGAYTIGTVVRITATPFPPHTFLRWNGAAIVGDRNSASTTVTIDEDRTLLAVFSP